MAVVRTTLPADSFLEDHARRGEYTDCYCVEVSGSLSLSQFLLAFYTTWLFKLERVILSRFVSKPSTDEQAGQLAHGEIDTFAAWSVAERDDEQILLADYVGRTCSWLRVIKGDAGRANRTTLYFGSAVMVSRIYRSNQPVRRLAFVVVLVFHKLYSRALLYLAARRAMHMAGEV